MQTAATRSAESSLRPPTTVILRVGGVVTWRREKHPRPSLRGAKRRGNPGKNVYCPRKKPGLLHYVRNDEVELDCRALSGLAMTSGIFSLLHATTPPSSGMTRIIKGRINNRET